MRFLVVEDNPAELQIVCNVLKSLGFEYDCAVDMASARNLLRQHVYAFVILDLHIPLEAGHFSCVENGQNLLVEIRTKSRSANARVIVVTGYGNEGPQQATATFKLAKVDEYIPKPISGAEVTHAIRQLLAQSGGSGVASGYDVPASEHRATGAGLRVADESAVAVAEAPVAVRKASTVRAKKTARQPSRRARELEPFNSRPRELVIYPDRIALLGAEIWRETEDRDCLEAQKMLNQKDEHGFVRVRFGVINKALGRAKSNSIAKPIHRFRVHACKAMREKGIACGRSDVMNTKAGGLHFTDWMVVRVVNEPAASPAALADRAASEPAKAPAAPPMRFDPLGNPLHDRQAWILDELARGRHLFFQDIVDRFDVDRSTLNRDLKDLRARGLIRTHPDGYYVLVETGANGGAETPPA